MRILVTGGAGFIGANLSALALERGHEVVVIDDFSTGERANLERLPVRLIEASILDVGALDEAMRGVTAVVHLAALGSVPRSIKDPVATHQANALGTLRVLEAARAAEVEHVSVASSSSVYGLNPALPKSEREWVRPMSPYAVSKLATEQYALAYQQSFGLQTLAFRFFNVFGPLQRAGHVYAAVIPVFMDALLAARPLPVNGDGSNSRDFTFVGTVCQVLLEAAARRVVHEEPVNLAFGTNTTLLQLISRMESVTGRRATVDHREPRPGDVLHSQADNAVLRSLFPDVRPVSLDDGLRATYEWFLQA
ncbi:MAG: NAD-dependent epimerase/dehydratase family protein [Actinomycetales bacterium]|nr:NAD-dependent epimerase/dehydratase family protein [Actinomycetales bacterium]